MPYKVPSSAKSDEPRVCKGKLRFKVVITLASLEIELGKLECLIVYTGGLQPRTSPLMLEAGLENVPHLRRLAVYRRQ